MNLFRNGRRSFLRGAAGFALALPMLEFTQRPARAAVEPARRLIVVFSHGGNISCRDRSGKKQNGQGNHHGWDLWAPPTESTTLSQLGEELDPLTPYIDDLIQLRGVDNMAGAAAAYGGGHNSSNATALTAADFNGSNQAQGPSIDQVVASRLNAAAPSVFPSLSLAINGHNYGTPLYSAPNQTVSSERNPVLAFDQIFGQVTPSGGPDPELLRLREMKRSVLDGVLGGFNELQGKVGQSDAVLLEAHADHIRGMEQALEALDNVAACTIPDNQGAINKSNYGPEAEQVGPLMVDYLVHAMRCGLTNVGSLLIGDLLTKWLPSPFSTDLGHSLGHSARDIGATGPDKALANQWRTTITNNRQWRAGLLARLLEGLKSTPEGGGTMLDHSIVLYTSEFSCASVHSVRDVPMLLAGRAGNRWQTGRHYNYNTAVSGNPSALTYSTNASTHNVFTSILHAFDFNDSHFGNDQAYKTGPLAELG